MRKIIITVADYINAIEKNGVPKTKHAFIRKADRRLGPIRLGERIIGACAIGQAALNLQIGAYGLCHAVSDIYPSLTTITMGQDLANRSIQLNDDTDKSFQEIADQLRFEFSGVLSQRIDI